MHLLRDIAKIRSGYLFRGKVEPEPGGEYQVIQIGDITPDARLTSAALVQVNLPDVKPSQVVKLGDVLFISRGTRKRAAAITEPLNTTIASSQLFVLHPKDNVLPEYLAWYLNQQPAQRYIEEHATGSNVSLINMESLGGLVVQIPPLETQRQIVEIHKLSLREKELLEKIQAKRSQLIERALLKTLEASERVQ
jgi:restriction endonuclease S subunit